VLQEEPETNAKPPQLATPPRATPLTNATMKEDVFALLELLATIATPLKFAE